MSDAPEKRDLSDMPAACPLCGQDYQRCLFAGGALLPPSLFEHPAAELSVDDSAQLGEDRRQPDHIA
jgi:hypothetical protein